MNKNSVDININLSERTVLKILSDQNGQFSIEIKDKIVNKIVDTFIENYMKNELHKKFITQLKTNVNKEMKDAVDHCIYENPKNWNSKISDEFKEKIMEKIDPEINKHLIQKIYSKIEEKLSKINIDELITSKIEHICEQNYRDIIIKKLVKIL